MPYGPIRVMLTVIGVSCFNPSYGLHALRALFHHCTITKPDVSIPHMGCMPYGLRTQPSMALEVNVSIPHMGCMPYGRRGAGRLEVESLFQSLIWVACPTGGARWVAPATLP